MSAKNYVSKDLLKGLSWITQKSNPIVVGFLVLLHIHIIIISRVRVKVLYFEFESKRRIRLRLEAVFPFPYTLGASSSSLFMLQARQFCRSLVRDSDANRNLR
jgi:hypothetical protein